MSDAKAMLQAAIDALGLTVTAVFVPWSQSRNFKAGGKVNDRLVNWTITIKRNGRDVLTTDYTAGLAHAPAYNNTKAYGMRFSILKTEALTYETEHGKAATISHGGSNTVRSGTKCIEPDPIDVVWSLIQDASVIDAGGFESWASDLGYDTDSRTAEATYRACLEIALKLRAGIGEAGLRQLQEAGQDY